jgi:anaerobilin synthase
MINNLLLFDKRYKSHHDSTGLISKYVPSEKTDKSSFEAMLEIKPDDRKKAIYVHTPYCDKICSFCNLNRKQLDGSLDSYTERIKRWKDASKHPDENDLENAYNYFKNLIINL